MIYIISLLRLPFMEIDRFDECILINDEKGFTEFGSSAYWAPSDIDLVSSCYNQA